MNPIIFTHLSQSVFFIFFMIGFLIFNGVLLRNIMIDDWFYFQVLRFFGFQLGTSCTGKDFDQFNDTIFKTVFIKEVVGASVGAFFSIPIIGTMLGHSVT